MDLETYTDNGKHVPYACGFYGGKHKKLYFVTDYNHWEEMIKDILSELITPKYTGYKLYLHNFNK